GYVVVVGGSLGRVEALELGFDRRVAAVVGDRFGLDGGIALGVVGGGDAFPAAGAICFDLVHGHGGELTRALVLPHYVRHADAGEHKVVPARGNGRVAVERAQVRIDVVGARGAGVDRLGARDDGQVGRHGTEP